jgi:enoyl-CoA hydratase
MNMAQPTTAERTDVRTLVHAQVRDGVVTLTLDDPPANTYTHEMMRQLDEAILAARFNKDVHVIVITGQGGKFFCAGANIGMLAEAEPNFKYYFCLHANETLNRLEQTPKLVIAALNGHTVGGGLEIAMAADLRIAKKDAGKVGLPEITLGVLPGTGGTQRLARLIGKSKSIELMATGRLISFEDAEELGIVNQILAGDDFLEQVHAYAKQFCPPHRASKAVGRIKRSVQSGAEVPFESGLAIERELQQQLFESKDAREGLDAYIGKRTPQFKGA